MEKMKICNYGHECKIGKSCYHCSPHIARQTCTHICINDDRGSKDKLCFCVPYDEFEEKDFVL